jgi:hypothetical protein
MSGSNRNFVLAYIFLVILPLVGLAGILKAGRGMSAPVSIDGVWNVQLDSALADSQPCGKALAGILDKTIAIAQSGRTFVVTLPSDARLTGSGTLDGTALHASLPGPQQSDSSSCLEQRDLSLVASVEKKAEASFLAGTLSVPNCATCASVAFHAERQASLALKGGH